MSGFLTNLADIAISMAFMWMAAVLTLSPRPIWRRFGWGLFVGAAAFFVGAGLTNGVFYAWRQA